MIYDEKENVKVCKALERVGIYVNSVYDLVNSRASYAPAIPVLLEMLQEVKSDRMIEGVARALTVKEARGIAARPLIDYFRNYIATNRSEEGAKWAVGNALSIVADDSVFDDLVEIARDKRHGGARDVLPRALANIRKPIVVDILIEFLEDEDMAGRAISALGKLRAKKAKRKIERFLSHPKAWVRTEAKRALAKIDKTK